MKPPIYSETYNEWVVCPIEFVREQWDWCGENLEGNVIRSGDMFWFESEGDANLFYLRWK